jgi:hypothetical protein
MTDSELDEIEKRANAATPGSWTVGHPDVESDDGRWVEGIMAANGNQIVETDSGYYPPRRMDADFIAAAREDVPKLVAEVRRLQHQLNQAIALLNGETVELPIVTTHPQYSGKIRLLDEERDIADYEELQRKKLSDAVRSQYEPGMDERALLGAVMKHLTGKANPLEVLELIRSFLVDTKG